MAIPLEYDCRTALSAYIQGTWGTRLVDGSLTKAFPARGANPMARKPEFQNDAEESGKGHEFVTRHDLEYWDTKKSLQYDLDSWMAAWIGAFGLGQASESGPGAQSEYTHTLKFSAPDTTAQQNPFTTIVEDRDDGEKEYYPDMVVAGFELAGQLKQRPTLSIDLVGSGRVEDGSAFTMPALASASFLRFSGLQFQWGQSGSLADESSKLRSFNIKVDNALLLDDGYVAGGGNYRSRLWHGLPRACSLGFSLFRDAQTQKAFLEADTQLQGVFTFTGALIGGAVYHKLTVTFTAIKIAEIVASYENKREVLAVTTEPFYTAADAGPMKWEVVNLEPEYLKAEA